MELFFSKTKPAVLLLVLIFLVSFLFKQIDFETEEVLEVYFLDVGQGDAIFVNASNGEQILIDAGRGDKVLDELGKVMNFADKKIDTLIISHGDLDHIGGLFEIIDIYDVEKILRSNVKIESQFEERLLRTADQYGIEIVEIKSGDTIIIDPKRQIYFDVLHPPTNPKEDFDRNENSLVLRLVFGQSEFLLTGDATKETENTLLNYYGESINSDVLKVGHHGSKSSTSQTFLDNVSPNFAVISYGENSYGHPHEEVIENLKEDGIEIFETKKSGTIGFETDGEQLLVEILDSRLSILEKLFN
jgi:competence protein ComEC